VSERVLRIGTRGSELALAQSGIVADALVALDDRRPRMTTLLVRIRTQGDSDPAPLTTIGGTGVFVAAVRAALLTGVVDIAVHSFKDLPTAAAPGLTLGAVPSRADPSDALCASHGRRLDQLPDGARVGTGSPRRAAQLLRRRPDLQISAIRGNVGTRLAMVTDGRLDAVVLATAGLMRLGLLDVITEVLDERTMLPAPAQGALAVECRAVDRDTAWFWSVLARLDDPVSRACATAERAVLLGLEAGCSAPVGASATMRGDTLAVTAVAISPSGADEARGTIDGPATEAAELGAALADQLLAGGADRILAGGAA
jgi:hydroxymethylbilane synthase